MHSALGEPPSVNQLVTGNSHVVSQKISCNSKSRVPSSRSDVCSLSLCIFLVVSKTIEFTSMKMGKMEINTSDTRSHAASHAP